MTNYELSTPINTNDFSSTQLIAPILNIARISWLGLVGFTFILFVASLIVGFGQLQQVCTNDLCHPVQLSSREAMINQQLGLSLDFYALYTTLTFAIFGGVCFFVGGMIFWNRSDNWLSLFISLFLIMVGACAIPTLGSLEVLFPQLHWFRKFGLIIGLWSLPIVLYIFPDGRLVPGWTRWLLLTWLAYNVLLLFIKPLPTSGIMSGPPSVFTQFVFLTGGLSQIYRYRQTENRVRKQQTKWALFGFVGHITCLILLVQVLNFVPALSTPGTEQLIYRQYAFAFCRSIADPFYTNEPIGLYLALSTVGY